jgi:hypothetical protein
MSACERGARRSRSLQSSIGGIAESRMPSTLLQLVCLMCKNRGGEKVLHAAFRRRCAARVRRCGGKRRLYTKLKEVTVIFFPL